jgi:hypothetical protein
VETKLEREAEARAEKAFLAVLGKNFALKATGTLTLGMDDWSSLGERCHSTSID